MRSYLFEAGGETITAHRGPGITLACGGEARLEEFRVGSAILITAAEVERHAEPAAECSTDRTQRLAVILANNPGAPHQRRWFSMIRKKSGAEKNENTAISRIATM